MELLIIIGVIYILYRALKWVIKSSVADMEEKQRATQPKRSNTAAEMDSFISSALQEATNLSAAACQIKQAGKHAVSPLEISIVSVDSVVAHLLMEFTVYSVDTLPFYDLEMSTSIVSGHEKPCYVSNFTPAKLEMGMGEDELSKVFREKHDALLQECCQAIYQDFFGSTKNFFKMNEIYSYDCKPTSYPRGNVRICCDYTSLKAGNYARSFEHIYKVLRETYYPTADVAKDGRRIVVTF